MKVAVYGLKSTPEILTFLQLLYKKILGKNIEISIYKDFFDILQQQSHFNQTLFKTYDSYEELQAFNPNLVLTFGGDGTILNAITIVRDSRIPIVGVNTGRMGFLASIQKNDFLRELDDFLQEDFIQSPRSILELNNPIADIEYPFALNEFAITRNETTSMITIDTYVNNQFLNSFWADGLIISTPTGSTGYSLSTGGPIVAPENNAIVITPIAPHNLNVRPLTLPDNVTLKLYTKSRVPEYSLSLDSRLYSLPTTQELIIKKADYPILLGQSKNYNFFNTLREKLNWGYDLRN